MNSFFIPEYGKSIEYETYNVLNQFNMTDAQKAGILEIWDFLSRVSLVLQERYKDDHQHGLSINDFKLIRYRIVNTKMGNVKEIVSQKDLPFRTLLFFNNSFTAFGKASEFFNNQNRANGINWLLDNHLTKLHKWSLSDWVQDGLIAHNHAIHANYHNETIEQKRLY